MAPKKTPPKSPRVGSGPPRRNAVGGLLLTGNPGNKGGGRKPDAFKAMMRELASSEDTEKALKTILADPDHPQYVSALKLAAERGYGPVKQEIEHSGALTLEGMISQSFQEKP